MHTRVEEPGTGSPPLAIVQRHSRCPVAPEADEILARALAGMPVSIILQDKDLVFVWVVNIHPKWRVLDVIGKDDMTAGLRPDMMEPLVPVKRRVIETGIPYKTEVWLPSPDGTELFARVEFDPYPFPDGTTGVLGKILNVSASQNSDKHLMELNRRLADKLRMLMMSERRFRLALEGEMTSFFIQDEDLRFVWVHNVQLMSPENMIGKTDLELGFPNETGRLLHDMKLEVQRTGNRMELEQWAENIAGETRYYHLVLEPFPMLTGKSGILGKLRDLTQHKATEEQLKRTNQQLEETNKVLSVMVDELSAKNATIEAQLEEARQMQISMLPKNVPMPELFDLYADMATSAHVGGDYFDYLPVDEEGIAVAMGDATGHGISSGIIVSAVKSYFQIYSQTRHPASVLNIISTALEQMRLKQNYMGLAVFRFDGQAFYYASAGMPPLYWYHRERDQLEEIEQKTVFLGTGLIKQYQQVTLPLRAGDVVIMLSDGYTESFHKTKGMIDLEAVKDCVLEAVREDPATVVTCLKALQADWLEGQPIDDDSTVVVLLYKGSAGVTPVPKKVPEVVVTLPHQDGAK